MGLQEYLRSRVAAAQTAPPDNGEAKPEPEPRRPTPLIEAKGRLEEHVAAYESEAKKPKPKKKKKRKGRIGRTKNSFRTATGDKADQIVRVEMIFDAPKPSSFGVKLETEELMPSWERESCRTKPPVGVAAEAPASGSQ